MQQEIYRVGGLICDFDFKPTAKGIISIPVNNSPMLNGGVEPIILTTHNKKLTTCGVL
jgi:hypothetical protein